MGEENAVAEAQKRLADIKAGYPRLSDHDNRYPIAAMRNAELAIEHFSEPQGDGTDLRDLQEYVSMSVLASGAALEAEIVSLHLFIYQVLMALHSGGVNWLLLPEQAMMNGAQYDGEYLRTAEKFAKTFVRGHIESSDREYRELKKLIVASCRLAAALEVKPKWPEEEAERLRILRNRYVHEVVTPYHVRELGIRMQRGQDSQGRRHGRMHAQVANTLYWGHTPHQLADDCLMAFSCMCRCLETLNSMQKKMNDFSTMYCTLQAIGVVS